MRLGGRRRSGLGGLRLGGAYLDEQGGRAGFQSFRYLDAQRDHAWQLPGCHAGADELCRQAGEGDFERLNGLVAACAWEVGAPLGAGGD